MRLDKKVQSLFSEAEYILLMEAAARNGTTSAHQGRKLLLEWTASALSIKGGTRGGTCGSSGGCSSSDAIWFNQHAKFFCCAGCAEERNRYYPGTCTLDAPDRLSKEDVERLQAQIVTEGRRENLLQALVDAAHALSDYDAKTARADKDTYQP